jgi:hypothetical protein
MRKSFGAFLIVIGLIPLAYAGCSIFLFGLSLGDIGCGQNPFVLRLTAFAVGIGLSSAFAGHTVAFRDTSRGKALLGRQILWTWVGAGLVIAASLLALPPCPFPSR